MTASVETLMRPPAEVMQLDRMGAAFQTRLSFMRTLLRRMAREGWRFSRPVFELDEDGFGHAVYSVNTGGRTYSLVAFSHALDPELRNDRVIAEAWDATFNLFDGVPEPTDIARLAQNTPKQEAGRFTANELVLARANKSERLFNHVAAELAKGNQPDIQKIKDVGYLMRTTAVYGSGKFGCADRDKIADRAEINSSFQVEMLTVYLIRQFSIDLVEHIARQTSAQACPISADIRRYLGIGNATGLGMAPFLINHQVLLHQWVYAKELALARVKNIERLDTETANKFHSHFCRAKQHVGEWQVEDEEQMNRITTLRNDLTEIEHGLDQTLAAIQPFNALFKQVDSDCSNEARELVISLLLECAPELVDELGESFIAENEESIWDPSMSSGELLQLIEQHYPWADPESEATSHRIWYYSEEKLEPRLGTRLNNPDIEAEMPLAISRDICLLQQQLKQEAADTTVLLFCARHPEFRHVVKRVQIAAQYPYGEIAGNLLSETFRPIDILRFKLAYFGVSGFDPKSALWTRVCMYQGAPCPDELTTASADTWAFPVAPELTQ